MTKPDFTRYEFEELLEELVKERCHEQIIPCRERCMSMNIIQSGSQAQHAYISHGIWKLDPLELIKTFPDSHA